MIKIELQNIQAIGSAEINIAENTITVFSGDNSNGKSILSKVIEAVTSGDIKTKDIRHRDIIDNLRWCKAKHLTFQNMLNAFFIIRNNGLQHLVAIQAFDYLRRSQQRFYQEIQRYAVLFPPAGLPSSAQPFWA